MDKLKEYSVAINYTVDGVLKNDNNVPLLFSWEDKSKTVEQCLIEDEDLWKWIRSNGGLDDLITYMDGCLSWYEYSINDEGNLEYHQYSKPLVELRPIEWYDIDENMISHFLYVEVSMLYNKCFEKPIDVNLYMKGNTYDHNGMIRQMCANMKDKYKEKLTVTTIIEAVRSNLQTNDFFSNDVIDSLMNVLSKVLESK